MGCTASTYAVALVSGSVTNPTKGAFGDVTVHIPGDFPRNANTPIRLHHLKHGLLVQKRISIKGRIQVTFFEVVKPDACGPRDNFRVSLHGSAGAIVHEIGRKNSDNNALETIEDVSPRTTPSTTPRSSFRS